MIYIVVNYILDIESDTPVQESTNDRIYSTPAQDSVATKISVLESQLNSALMARNAGLIDDNSEKNIEKLKKSLFVKKNHFHQLKRMRVDKGNLDRILNQKLNSYAMQILKQLKN